MELHNGPIVTDSAYLHDFFKQLQDFAKTNNVIELVAKRIIFFVLAVSLTVKTASYALNRILMAIS